LEADLGVTGEPDAFFAQFDSALGGAAVDNVVHPTEATPVRKFFAPLAEREYDDEIVDEMERFYGHSVLYGPRAPTVAVEVSRGCPFRCSFCAEPAVKGHRTQYRDLDAVFGDLEFLVRRGLRSFWLVCSELNHGSADLAVEVAQRFLKLRERYPERPINWRAYVLPRWLSASDMDLLHRSGFSGGWNDFPSLDDRNLSDNRVPYRTRHIHEHLEQTLEMHRRDAVPSPPTFGAFLGNAHADPTSIVSTLDYFDQHFYGKFERAQIGTATRLLATMDQRTLDALAPNAVTFTASGAQTELDITLPTYALPTAVTDALGPGLESSSEFFEYVRTTLLSREFEQMQDWLRFLRGSLQIDWVRQQLAQLRLALPASLADTRVAHALSSLSNGGQEALQDLLDPQPADAEVATQVVKIISHRTAIRSESAQRLLKWLGFDDAREVSPWKLFRACSLRADTLGELISLLPVSAEGPEREAMTWLFSYYAFRYGLCMKPNFSRLVRAGLRKEGLSSRPRVHLPLSAAEERSSICSTRDSRVCLPL
jgi:hypothetical protein